MEPNTVSYYTQGDQCFILQEGNLLSTAWPIREGHKLGCTVKSIDLGYEKGFEYMFTRNKKDVGPWRYVKSCEHYPAILAMGKGLEIQVTLDERHNSLHQGTSMPYRLSVLIISNILLIVLFQAANTLFNFL